MTRLCLSVVCDRCSPARAGNVRLPGHMYVRHTSPGRSALTSERADLALSFPPNRPGREGRVEPRSLPPPAARSCHPPCRCKCARRWHGRGSTWRPRQRAGCQAGAMGGSQGCVGARVHGGTRARRRRIRRSRPRLVCVSSMSTRTCSSRMRPSEIRLPSSSCLSRAVWRPDTALHRRSRCGSAPRRAR